MLPGNMIKEGVVVEENIGHTKMRSRDMWYISKVLEKNVFRFIQRATPLNNRVVHH